MPCGECFGSCRVRVCFCMGTPFKQWAGRQQVWLLIAAVKSRNSQWREHATWGIFVDSAEELASKQVPGHHGRRRNMRDMWQSNLTICLAPRLFRTRKGKARFWGGGGRATFILTRRRRPEVLYFAWENIEYSTLGTLPIRISIIICFKWSSSHGIPHPAFGTEKAMICSVFCCLCRQMKDITIRI